MRHLLIERNAIASFQPTTFVVSRVPEIRSFFHETSVTGYCSKWNSNLEMFEIPQTVQIKKLPAMREKNYCTKL